MTSWEILDLKTFMKTRCRQGPFLVGFCLEALCSLLRKLLSLKSCATTRHRSTNGLQLRFQNVPSIQ